MSVQSLVYNPIQCRTKRSVFTGVVTVGWLKERSVSNERRRRNRQEEEEEKEEGKKGSRWMRKAVDGMRWLFDGKKGKKKR
jgi:hypothetical protein